MLVSVWKMCLGRPLSALIANSFSVSGACVPHTWKPHHLQTLLGT